MKCLTKKLLFSFFFVALAHFLIAQNVTTIRGTVHSALTGEEVENAEVTLLKSGKPVAAAVTTAAGYFQIDYDLSNEWGDVKLKVSSLVFFEEIIELTKEQGGEVFVYLQPSYETMEEALVESIRLGTENMGASVKLKKKSIEKVNNGQDLPFLLNQTPGAVVNSDAGAGVGYTGIRIRGVDQTRINVTVNGIPLNDAESQGVFWVNMPDFASSVNSIQIQRGVGTSTNGSAAFGGSINIKTDHISKDPFTKLDLGYGSFNTNRVGVHLSTGILPNKWGVQARFSQIQSDGFIDRARSDLQSAFLTAARYGDRSTFKVNVILGQERTYQAWNGIPQPKFNQNQEELATFIDELFITGEYADNLNNSAYNTYNFYTYENQVDNYGQQHFQAFYSYYFDNNWTLSTGLHYTGGAGYFEQYQDRNYALDDTELSFYGLNPVVLGGDTVTNTNLIRRRWLDNHFYGGVFSLTKNFDRAKWVLGGGLHDYIGDHFGEIIWAEFASNSAYEDRYYENDARKIEANLYSKVLYEFSDKINTFLDLQLRQIGYDFVGPDRNGVPIDQSADYLFFNPKAGISYRLNDRHSLALSAAVSNREPVRDDFVESTSASRPEHEQLLDMELTHRMVYKKWQAELVLYAMEYRNELVLTGAVNDVGAFTRTNVDRSYRRGLEVQAGYIISDKFRILGNAAWSMNEIVDFEEFVSQEWDDEDQMAFSYNKTTMAFSPAVVAGLVLDYDPFSWLNVRLDGKHVGQQFLDNSESLDRSLPAFTVFNLQASYSKRIGDYQVRFTGQVVNLLDLDYAPNGYTFGTILSGQRRSYNYVYPQAGRHFMLRATIQI
jgi:iron complex outermembrane receptor protein